MDRRTLLAASAAALAAPAAARAQAGRSQIVWWHAMTGVLGEEIERLAAGFNASQAEVEVKPVFKGTYTETLTAAIAAWRANQAPNLVQVFEVGTGSMLAAGPATKQIWQLSQEAGVAFEPAAYIPGVRGYYSLTDGRLASMPFNSSTALMWYNQDLFEKAGLDPAKPPATWDELGAAARAIKSKAEGLQAPITTSWFTWIQMEQYAAMHDQPFATKANGFGGLDTELLFNRPVFAKHLSRLLDWAKEGLFKYAGRDNTPDPLFPAGQVAIGFGSSAGRAQIGRDAKFRWASALLPTDPAVNPAPVNSIIGGASLWVMTAKERTAAEYKGAAQFLKYLAQPAVDAAWHQKTGYVPVTFGGYEESRKQGFYDKAVGADTAIKQLARGSVTDNSRGLRLGRLAEIRNIVYEEVEKALQGQQSAQQ
jgi:sn-glycerol 3-phosphate transport system substrate-binding protein